MQFAEQLLGLRAAGQHRFRHAVVQQGCHLRPLLGGDLGLTAQEAGFQRQAVFGNALHAVYRQAAVARNVSGLRGPGRDGAQARGGHHQHATFCAALVGLAIGQQGRQALLLCGAGRGVERHQVNVTRSHARDFGVDGRQGRLQLLGAEGAEGVAPRKRNLVHGHGSGGRCKNEKRCAKRSLPFYRRAWPQQPLALQAHGVDGIIST